MKDGRNTAGKTVSKGKAANSAKAAPRVQHGDATDTGAEADVSATDAENKSSLLGKKIPASPVWSPAKTIEHETEIVLWTVVESHESSTATSKDKSFVTAESKQEEDEVETSMVTFDSQNDNEADEECKIIGSELKLP